MNATPDCVCLPWYTPIPWLLYYSFGPFALLLVFAIVRYAASGRTHAARKLVILAAGGFASSLGTIAFIDFPGWQAYADQLVARAHGGSHVLAIPTSVDGNVLPAGSVLDRGNAANYTIALAQPAVIDGMLLQGTVEIDRGKPAGRLVLVRDSNVDGMPCQASQDVYVHGGRVTLCSLSHVTELYGIPCSGRLWLTRADASGVNCSLGRPFRYRGRLFSIGSPVSSGRVESLSSATR